MDGDEFAFREVFNRYQQKIFQFAFNFLKDKEQSEEIVQNTFLNFWLHRERLDPNLAFAPLLFTVARRTMVDAWRKEASSERFREHVRQHMDSTCNETEERVLLDELERVTSEALHQLNTHQQEVFRLSREEGLSYQEIADRLGISKHTVKYHLMNALRQLRAHFKRHDIHYLYFLFFIANQQG